MQVMELLESVYLLPYQRANTATEQAAAAEAVCKLLQGCAGLLRPAANCTVEWRCAALGLMTRAVEEFTEMHAGNKVYYLTRAALHFGVGMYIAGVLEAELRNIACTCYCLSCCVCYELYLISCTSSFWLKRLECLVHQFKVLYYLYK